MIVVRLKETGDGDHAVAAGTVLDDDRLTPFRGKLVGEQPRTDVDAAARTERDDESHRPVGPGVRGRARL